MRTETILRLGGIRDPATLTRKLLLHTDRMGSFMCWTASLESLWLATPFVNENWARESVRMVDRATTRERNCMPRVWHEWNGTAFSPTNSPVLRNGDGAVRFRNNTIHTTPPQIADSIIERLCRYCLRPRLRWS